MNTRQSIALELGELAIARHEVNAKVAALDAALLKSWEALAYCIETKGEVDPQTVLTRDPGFAEWYSKQSTAAVSDK